MASIEVILINAILPNLIIENFMQIPKSTQKYEIIVYCFSFE